jgi:hypothetical protein
MKLLAAGAATGALYAATVALERAIAAGRGAEGTHLTLYFGVTLLTFGLYAAVLGMCRRGELANAGDRALAVLLPVTFSIGLLFTHPQWSIDVFTYMVHGYQIDTGVNPYLQAAKDVADPFASEIAARGWIPVHGVSPYGALWTWVEAAIWRVGPHLDVQVLLFKSVSVLAMFGCAAAIWLILARVEPERRFLGLLTFLWNPVVILEVTGEGHNDAVMILFLLLAILWSVRRRAAAAVTSIAVGTLVKIVPLVFALPQAVFLWRRVRDRRRLVRSAVLGACASAAAGVLAYAPLWAGLPTLEGLRTHGRPSILASTPGVLLLYLSRSVPDHVVAPLLSLAMGMLFAACLLYASARVDDERSLVRACGGIAVAYLVFAPGYWPWYVILPITLLALAPDRRTIMIVMAFALCARLAAPIDIVRRHGLLTWDDQVVLTTAVGIWVPAIACAAAWARDARPWRYAAAIRARRAAASVRPNAV